MKRREPAYPMLIQDVISSSKEEVLNEEGYQRTFFISSTGARMYRVVLSGILMDKMDIGSEDSPIYRLRIADPTGGISFTLGRYNPELLSRVDDLETTYPVVVIGKVTSFISKTGDEVITLNPEEIQNITKEERSQWNILAVRDAMARLWMLGGRGPLPGRWMNVPRPDDPRGGEDLDEKAREMIKDTLRFLNKSFFARELDRLALGPRRIDPSGDVADPLEEYENMVLDMINELDKGNGTRWDDLIDYIDRNRLSRNVIEEVISNLLDKGMIYEPVLGFLKAI
jgi:RPA family protein